MNYFTAWLSLIGWNEAAIILAVVVLFAVADRIVLWHDKHLPWRGLRR